VEVARATDMPVAAVRLIDLIDLTKPRLNTLVLVTVAGGFLLGSGAAINAVALALTVIGAGLAGFGGAALNMLMERDADARMERTADRPLQTGRALPVQVLATGVALSVIGVGVLAVSVNLFSAALCALTLVLYLAVYTPLKSRTSLNTVVGAVAGAIPPVIGYVAATGRFDGTAWFLFAILFLWQLPHFLSIAWTYREDYRRAGYPMLPVIDPDGSMTARQILMHSVSLVLVSLYPVFVGATGTMYAVAASLLGVSVIAVAVAFQIARIRDRAARAIFRVSLAYLPGLMIVLLLESPLFGLLS
jgi:protoheme IX farnesyltransferase